MTTTISCKTPADIANAVPVMLGFHPHDSLVFVAPGSRAAAARLDLGPIATMAGSVAPVLPQWHRGVVAVFYTPDQDAFEMHAAQVARVVPGIRVIDMFRVHDGRYYAVGDPVGTAFDWENPLPERDAPLQSRDELVALAEAYTDADDAEHAACCAYQAGHGALARCLRDRAVALRGSSTHAMQQLTDRLDNAVDPRG